MHYSNDFIFVSGASKIVVINPINSNNEKKISPSDILILDTINGNANTPRIAPTLDAAVAIPIEVALILVGKISTG